MEKILVSACLLGSNVKYNGKNNLCEGINLLREKYDFILICPEVAGGLSIPRLPSEINGDCVVNVEGKDVSKEFYEGASKILELALKSNVKIAILKENSPSCGSSKVYDGSFGNRLIPGEGISAKLLKKKIILKSIMKTTILNYYKQYRERGLYEDKKLFGNSSQSTRN